MSWKKLGSPAGLIAIGLLIIGISYLAPSVLPSWAMMIGGITLVAGAVWQIKNIM